MTDNAATMTERDLADQYHRLGLTEDKQGDRVLAGKLDVSVVTVWRWRSGNFAIPRIAAMAIRSIRTPRIGEKARPKAAARPNAKKARRTGSGRRGMIRT